MVSNAYLNGSMDWLPAFNFQPDLQLVWVNFTHSISLLGTYLHFEQRIKCVRVCIHYRVISCIAFVPLRHGCHGNATQRVCVSASALCEQNYRNQCNIQRTEQAGLRIKQQLLWQRRCICNETAAGLVWNSPNVRTNVQVACRRHYIRYVHSSGHYSYAFECFRIFYFSLNFLFLIRTRVAGISSGEVQKWNTSKKKSRQKLLAIENNLKKMCLYVCAACCRYQLSVKLCRLQTWDLLIQHTRFGSA